jgi:hypothetical protein
MKHILLSFGCAIFLSTAFAAGVVTTDTIAQAKKDAPLKCAIHQGEHGLPRAAARGASKPESTAPCESYWGNDTAADEAELKAGTKTVATNSN